MTQRSPQWEIDDPTAQRQDVDEEGRPHTRYSSHSRGESTSSLLSTLRGHSAPQSPQRSLLASIADRFSLGKYYQNGTTKGSDYERVRVRPQHADPGFKIDDPRPTPPTQEPTPERALPSIPEPPAPDRTTSIPSVLDIRRPSTAQGIPSSLRHDSNDTHFTPPTAPHSDFSLGTTDLLTPTSPSSSFRPNVKCLRRVYRIPANLPLSYRSRIRDHHSLQIACLYSSLPSCIALHNAEHPWTRPPTRSLTSCTRAIPHCTKSPLYHASADYGPLYLSLVTVLRLFEISLLLSIYCIMGLFAFSTHRLFLV